MKKDDEEQVLVNRKRNIPCECWKCDLAEKCGGRYRPLKVRIYDSDLMFSMMPALEESDVKRILINEKHREVDGHAYAIVRIERGSGEQIEFGVTDQFIEVE